MPRNVPGMTSPMWFLLRSMYSREESERRSTSLIVWKGEERGFEMPEIPEHQKWFPNSAVLIPQNKESVHFALLQKEEL